MLQVCSDQCLCELPSAPSARPDCPEMLTPIALLQLWKLLLQQPGRTSLKALHKVTDRLGRRILKRHMDMILTHCPLEHVDVLSITDLHDQLSTPFLNVPFEDVIAVLRDSDKVDGQAGGTVTASSLLCHNGLRQSYHPCRCHHTSGDE